MATASNFTTGNTVAIFAYTQAGNSNGRLFSLCPAATDTVFFGGSNLHDELELTASDFTAGNTLAIFDSNARAENTSGRPDFNDCVATTPINAGDSLLTTDGVNGTLITVTIATDTTNPANWLATTACQIELVAQPAVGDELNLTVLITKGTEIAIKVFNITFGADELGSFSCVSITC